MNLSVARTLAAALLLSLSSWNAQAAALFTVDEAEGEVGLMRGPVDTLLQAGTGLQEGDSLRTADDAVLRINIARYGFIELGRQSELVLERVPHASYADDLRTALRLTRGTLRMVWVYPSPAGDWPMLVYFGNLRASLENGEYFFESSVENATPMCVAAGEAAVGVPGSTKPQRLTGAACYALRSDQPAKRQPRTPEDFVTARLGLSLTALVDAEQLTASMQYTPTSSVALSTPAEPEPEAPPPPAIAAPLPEGAWVVNLASSIDQDAAREDALRAGPAGYPVTVTAVEIKHQKWYRVQLVGFQNRVAAKEAAERLKTEFGFNEPWVQKAE